VSEVPLYIGGVRGLGTRRNSRMVEPGIKLSAVCRGPSNPPPPPHLDNFCGVGNLGTRSNPSQQRHSLPPRRPPVKGSVFVNLRNAGNLKIGPGGALV